MNVWVFNDASCAALLKKESPLFGGDSPDMIVEVSIGPTFEYHFGMQSPSGFPGISGLLTPNLGVDDLAVTIGNAYPKIIFAPNPSLSSSVLGSAIANLIRQTDTLTRVDLFIEFSLVRDLYPWLSACSKFSIVLDLSVAPEGEFASGIKEMSLRDMMVKDRWGGLHLFDSRDNSCALADDALLEQLGLVAIPKVSVIGK